MEKKYILFILFESLKLLELQTSVAVFQVILLQERHDQTLTNISKYYSIKINKTTIRV
jgi:hypothetical protein